MGTDADVSRGGINITLGGGWERVGATTTEINFGRTRAEER